ncbi:MAG: hypothetical protein Q8P59_08705, partial [Dehalococcoidia bacterium]|nr:hypothetical protein [Dehalococcoidia bacterium]
MGPWVKVSHALVQCCRIVLTRQEDGGRSLLSRQGLREESSEAKIKTDSKTKLVVVSPESHLGRAGMIDAFAVT